MKIAIRLDPLSAPVDSFLGRTCLWARRYNDALAHLQKSAQRFPNFALGHVRLAHLYTYIDMFNDAIAEETKARLLSGQDAHEVIKQEDGLRSALCLSRSAWQLGESPGVLSNGRQTHRRPTAQATVMQSYMLDLARTIKHSSRWNEPTRSASSR